jgi:branched-chain amino acid transport system ATP-binding protein
MGSLLEVADLTKSFGAVHAVAGATFTVEEGTITGLIGPNGAGKTTTFDLVSGRVHPDSGHVRFAGDEVTGSEAHRLAEAGLVRTFQIPRAFGRMTVWENLLFAGKDHPGEGFWAGLLSTGGSRRRERELGTRANEVLEFLEIDHVTDLPASSLSGGQRKLLELARTLMRSPRLILLDEPFAGVAPALTAKIADKLMELRRQGMTILLIEHDLETVMRLVDKLVVMHLGAVLVSGDPATVRSDSRVLEAYLGGAHA